MSRSFTFLLVFLITFCVFTIEAFSNPAYRQPFAPSSDQYSEPKSDQYSAPKDAIKPNPKIIGGVQESHIAPSEWCQSERGDTGITLPDGTELDCLTEDYVISISNANKWADAMGRARYGANATGREPAVVLILENTETQLPHLRRLLVSIQGDSKLWKVWVITPNHP
ncbi:MAG: hypothetical protein ACQ9MH_10685 [Nitrospinales bacterium]